MEGEQVAQAEPLSDEALQDTMTDARDCAEVGRRVCGCCPVLLVFRDRLPRIG